jgi:hypothetical protein
MKPTNKQSAWARFPKNVSPAEQIAELEAIAKGGTPSFPGTSHLSRKVAKELGEQISMVHRFRLEREADNGTTRQAFVYDEMVKELIRAVESGQIDMASNPNHLLRVFADLVCKGHLGTLLEIGSALKRVHARAKRLKPGGPLLFSPARPARLKAIEQAQLAGTAPTSGATVSAAADETISDRTARRINRKLGLKPGKAGRPKTVGTKDKAEKRIRLTDTNLRAEIDKGSRHFYQTRKRPESAWVKSKK